MWAQCSGFHLVLGGDWGCVLSDGKDIEGSSCGPFTALRRICREWLSLMNDSAWGSRDAGWWYKERASLSLFAGAAWRTRAWAMEEYASHKSAASRKWKGRGDLILELREPEISYVAESETVLAGYGSEGSYGEES